jgi:hypothetical protein
MSCTCGVCFICCNPGRPPQAAPRSLPCIYLGGVLDRLGCACPAKWQRACGVHAHCTLEACKTCPDYEAG